MLEQERSGDVPLTLNFVCFVLAAIEMLNERLLTQTTPSLLATCTRSIEPLEEPSQRRCVETDISIEQLDRLYVD
jgi:hypothetical protein